MSWKELTPLIGYHQSPKAKSKKKPGKLLMICHDNKKRNYIDGTNIPEAELLTPKSLEERSLGVRCSGGAPTSQPLIITTVGFPIVNPQVRF